MIHWVTGTPKKIITKNSTIQSFSKVESSKYNDFINEINYYCLVNNTIFL